MSFFFKRYLKTLAANWLYLLLILIAPLIYFIASIVIDSTLITRDIQIPKDSLVELGMLRPGKPRMKSVNEIISYPSLFFNDSIAMIELHLELYPDKKIDRKSRLFANLINTVKSGIHITSPANEIIRIYYQGKDERTGKIMVNYYSSRLVKQTKKANGITIKDSYVPTKWTEDMDLINEIRVGKDYVFWKESRLFPLISFLMASLFVILLIFAIVEIIDSSFKSDRDVTRYLNLPILGSIPDLRDLSKKLIQKKT